MDAGCYRWRGAGRPFRTTWRHICPRSVTNVPASARASGIPLPGTRLVWFRFNSATAQFPLIQSRLLASTLSGFLVESGGHIWIQLDLPLQTDEEGMSAALLSQIQTIRDVAYAPWP